MTRTRWRFLILLGGLFVGVASAGRADVMKERSYFESGGRRIAVDGFLPDTAGPHRKVIVLPGAGGMLFDGPQMKRVARGLAEAGLAAYVVNYFQRTGSVVALSDEVMMRNFATWMETVGDAVDWAAGLDGRADPVGIYGYSLGGFLAVAVGSVNDRVGAVVEQSGGIWDKFYDPPDPLPPVLVIHGKKDDRVWFDLNTERMRRYVERDGGTFTMLAFADEPHRFSDEAMAESVRAAEEFFRERLIDQ